CLFFFFPSRRRHTILVSDWSSDVCSSDLPLIPRWSIPASPATSNSAAIRPTVQNNLSRRARGTPAQSFFSPPCISTHLTACRTRSEERRVGKEGRSRRAPEH